MSIYYDSLQYKQIPCKYLILKKFFIKILEFFWAKFTNFLIYKLSLYRNFKFDKQFGKHLFILKFLAEYVYEVTVFPVLKDTCEYKHLYISLRFSF